MYTYTYTHTIVPKMQSSLYTNINSLEQRTYLAYELTYELSHTHTQASTPSYIHMCRDWLTNGSSCLKCVIVIPI